MTPPNSLCTNASRHGKWFNAVPRDSSVTFLSYDALLFQSNASSTRQSTPPARPLCAAFLVVHVFTDVVGSHPQGVLARAGEVGQSASPGFHQEFRTTRRRRKTSPRVQRPWQSSPFSRTVRRGGYDSRELPHPSGCRPSRRLHQNSARIPFHIYFRKQGRAFVDFCDYLDVLLNPTGRNTGWSPRLDSKLSDFNKCQYQCVAPPCCSFPLQRRFKKL